MAVTEEYGPLVDLAPFLELADPALADWIEDNRVATADVLWEGLGLGPRGMRPGAIMYEPAVVSSCDIRRDARMMRVLYVMPDRVLGRDEYGFPVQAAASPRWLSLAYRLRVRRAYESNRVDLDARSIYDTPEGDRPLGAFPVLMGRRGDALAVLRRFLDALGVRSMIARALQPDGECCARISTHRMTRRDVELILSVVHAGIERRGEIRVSIVACHPDTVEAVLVPRRMIPAVAQMWRDVIENGPRPLTLAWATQLAAIVADELQSRGGDLAGLGEYIALRAKRGGDKLVPELNMIATLLGRDPLADLILAEMEARAPKSRGAR